MASITDFPPELISTILSFLPCADIVRASKACKKFYEASKSPQIWRKRCLEDYSATVEPWLSERIYKKLFYKYRQLLGLWKPDIKPYGGLFQLKVVGDKICGYEWRPPKDPHVKNPLRKKEIFCIEFSDNDDDTETWCLAGRGDKHPCNIEFITKWSAMNLRKDISFTFRCICPDDHKHPGGTEAEVHEYIADETENGVDLFNPHDHELLLMKFLMLRQYESVGYHKLELPPPLPHVPLQPGLFKGTYSAHGLELVLVQYKDGGKVIEAVKVTGDPNIPAGKVTFKAEIPYAMLLTSKQQLTIKELLKIQPSESDVPYHELPPQPFVVPGDCFDRFPDIPTECKSRFHGFGQIAGHGFQNSSFCPGHIIIFNEDLFGFLWFDLLSLAIFHRVQERFDFESE